MDVGTLKIDHRRLHRWRLAHHVDELERQPDSPVPHCPITARLPLGYVVDSLARHGFGFVPAGDGRGAGGGSSASGAGFFRRRKVASKWSR